MKYLHSGSFDWYFVVWGRVQPNARYILRYSILFLSTKDKMDDSKEFAVPALPRQKETKSEAPEPAPALPKEHLQKLPQPPSLNYEKPSWSAQPIYAYRLEVLKNGASIDTIQGLKKEFVTIGRLPICDMPMEHPSVSRYQAIIQFDHDGNAYLYDLDSAHGTRVNKKAVPKRDYVKLNPGDQIRFGESTRLCIFDSEKPYDPEAEAEERRQIALKQRLAKARGDLEQNQTEDVESQGISWGFQEDAVEDDDEDEYNGGENTVQDIEASLDKSGDAGLLSVEAEKMAFEDAKRRREDLKIMYDDDSDEELYDKTSRKKKKAEKAETHGDLVRKQKQAKIDIAKIEKEIAEKKEAQAKKDNEAAGAEEDLDAYMDNLTKKPENNKSLFALQKELNQLKKDNDRLIKLVKLTKPSDIL
ncbi:SMAD/FHA domain-containing protein [Parasitella parasitica]|nr:SMAD/FHA domain-containing protein [Parasitella parasitica]